MRGILTLDMQSCAVLYRT